MEKNEYDLPDDRKFRSGYCINSWLLHFFFNLTIFLSTSPQKQPSFKVWRRALVQKSSPELSVNIPCFNEAENLTELINRLEKVFPAHGELDLEFIIVDDGSSDGSAAIVADLAKENARIVPVYMPSRRGQTDALWQGLQAARGTWVGHLDGDLQNDPADLPVMYKRAQCDQLDAVLGYRLKRHDSLGRRLASQFANGVRRFVLHDAIRDVGCSTRVVRLDVLSELQPVKNLHRYLPALIELGGWRIAQVPVRHHERTRGVSKYGNLNRGFEGLRDLPRIKAYVKALQERLER